MCSSDTFLNQYQLVTVKVNALSHFISYRGREKQRLVVGQQSCDKTFFQNKSGY